MEDGVAVVTTPVCAAGRRRADSLQLISCQVLWRLLLWAEAICARLYELGEAAAGQAT